MNIGKLIVIEGVDGSGKTTQFELLKQKLRDNFTVNSMHFPRHKVPFFGVMVDEYLTGEFGDATKIHPRLAGLIYAMDRWEAKPQLETWLSQGIVLLDRYTTSNKGHQLGKIKEDDKRDEYLKWLDELEYNVLKIPKPDLVFYLSVPIEQVQKLLETRTDKDKDYSKGGKDQHEASLDHLKNTREAYLYTCQKYDYWKKIDCIKDRKLMSIDEIHELLWQEIKKII